MMGGYYHKALSKHVKVTCVGPSFGEAKSNYELRPGQKLQPIIDQLNDKPDVLICFYSKPDLFPPDLYEINLPKAWYVYDTHLHLEELSATAYLFDLVICTDEPTRERMSAAGHCYTKTLGFAADKTLYYRPHNTNRKKKYQVGFAGSVYGHPQLKKRQELLERLQRKYDVRIEHRTLKGAAVADFFQECQVVINQAINDDLNMRVPEVLLSGRPLLTPEVTGLELQYNADQHLRTFNNENVEEKLNELLNDVEKSEAMALRGQQWAMENHTYDHRAVTLIEYLKELVDKNSEGTLSSKNKLLLEFAQFNYHRFRYPGDAIDWLNQKWVPKNAPEEALKKLLKLFSKSLRAFCRFSKRSYFQDMNRD